MTSSMSRSSPDGSDPELELGVGEDDPRPLADLGAAARTARATPRGPRSRSAWLISVGDALERDVLVVLAGGRLPGGREDRLRQAVALAQAGRERDRRRSRRSPGTPSSPSPTGSRGRRTRPGSTSASRPIIIRPRSSAATPGSATRARPGGPPGSVPSRWLATMSAVSREPEPRQAGEHAALVGDRRGQDDVERGQPVRRDEQQPVVVDPVQVADLARAQEQRLACSIGTSLRHGPWARPPRARRAGR